jgi:hypothetical protein
MDTVVDDDLLRWLLEGDPAIRWRVLHDLTDASDDDMHKEQHRVATQGWGARLLAEQNPDGGWGDGDYSPKWTSTTYTLLRLLWLGLLPGNAAALKGCARLWAWRERWRVPETSLRCSTHKFYRYESAGLNHLVEYLLDSSWPMAVGTAPAAATGTGTVPSHEHSGIEALDAYARSGGRIQCGEASLRGREFFLSHKLYLSHRTGAVAIRGSTRFPAFPEWHFDVLRGLEHFAQVDAGRDERLGTAIDVVRSARRKDGRWSTYSAHPGRQWFQLEPPGPSRWNTARALRVLRWWEERPRAGRGQRA